MSDEIIAPAASLLAPGPRYSREAKNESRCKSLWWLLAALIMGCVATNHGSLLNLSLPAIVFLMAVFFARSSPQNFIRLMVATFVLAPLVRRLADNFGGGFTDPSPILLTPYLVPIAGLASIRFSQLLKRRSLPFSLALLGIGYGLVIGLLRNPEHTAVLISALRWISPIAAGLYLLDQQIVRGLDLTNVMITSIRWAALGSAAYGLIQIALLPSWDLFWLKMMLETGVGDSYGRPMPFNFRAFGTLNGTGVAAAFWGIGFLFWLFDSHRLKMVALPLLAAALFLTQVRTEWSCLPIAVLVGLLISRQGRREALVSLVACAGILVLAAGLLAGSVPEIANSVGDRLNTMGSAGGDESLNSRTDAIHYAIAMLNTMPFGAGLGFLDGPEYGRTPMSNRAGATGTDLGLIGIVFDLGYLGSAAYLSGVLGLCVFTWRLRQAEFAAATLVKVSVLLLLLHAWSNDPFSAPIAFILWLAGAIACGQAGMVQQPLLEAENLKPFTGGAEQARLVV